MNHTYVAQTADTYISIHNSVAIKVINNPNPLLDCQQQHVIYLPILCEKSKNPKSTSYLEISYQAGEKFLEVFSLEAYIKGFINHPLVRDVEYLTQEIALELVAVLGTGITVTGYYDLQGLSQSIITKITISDQQLLALNSK